MTEYEKLLDSADKQHVIVTEKFDLSETRLKGLYCDAFIAIDKNLTDIDKACVLAEELGHHATTYGNIIDQSTVTNRKQERDILYFPVSFLFFYFYLYLELFIVPPPRTFSPS